MKKSVIFILLICVLLSVFPFATVFAETTETENNIQPFTQIGDNVFWMLVTGLLLILLYILVKFSKAKQFKVKKKKEEKQFKYFPPSVKIIRDKTDNIEK